jgi:3-methyladenine DNA glycosylase AlkD
MKLLALLRTELANAANPDKAPQMQAYMKSAMPFHGVPSTAMRQVAKQAFKDLVFDDAKQWQREVLAIWRGARFREERYCAIELTGLRAARAFHTPDVMAMYEELIVTGAWWDYVDVLASNRVGDYILRKHPAPLKKLMRAWSTSDDLWKRRTSIICQLRFKEQTDVELLYACIEPSLPSKEFFLRKAIGWALREYAKHDAREITRYVNKNRARLSGLSVREALKNVVESAP